MNDKPLSEKCQQPTWAIKARFVTPLNEMTFCDMVPHRGLSCCFFAAQGKTFANTYTNVILKELEGCCKRFKRHHKGVI